MEVGFKLSKNLRIIIKINQIFKSIRWITQNPLLETIKFCHTLLLYWDLNCKSLKHYQFCNKSYINQKLVIQVLRMMIFWKQINILHQAHLIHIHFNFKIVISHFWKWIQKKTHLKISKYIVKTSKSHN